MSSLAPAFLVALDVLVDPNFRRSVVLLLEHGEDQGAIGLVVNRTTEVPLGRLCESLSLPWRGTEEARVDWGGPVGQDQGWVLLGSGVPDEVESISLIPGVRWARSQAALKFVASNPELPARVMLGYAGWAAGQLEREIAEGAWLVVPASERIVFREPHGAMWEQAIRSLGIDPAMLVASHGVN